MKEEMKKRLINIGIGVIIGVVITSIGFIIYINAKGVGRKPDFSKPPQMTQGQEFKKDGKGKPNFSNGEKKESNDESSKSAPAQEQPDQTQQQANT